MSLLPKAVFFALAVLSVSVAVSDAAAEPGVREHPVYEFSRFVALREPQAVIGFDEREQITDTTAFPWSAIAWLGLYDSSQQEIGSCTGTLVGPDTVLTAAHCLYDDADGYVANIVVVPGKDGAFEPFGYQFAYDWWVPQGWIDGHGDELYDYGVISLPDSDLGNTAGWFSVASLSTDTLNRADFMPAIVGYPGDMPEGTMWGDVKPAFETVGGDLFTYEIDTFAGESGSAIFSANTSEWFLGYVVGIHNAFTGSVNQGSRVESVLLSDLLDACDAVVCSIEVYEETAGGELAWADVDCTNAAPDIGDAIIIARFTIGLTSVFSGCPTIGDFVTVDGTTRAWGDANCSNILDLGDAIVVARTTIGLPPTQPAGCPDIGDIVSVET